MKIATNKPNLMNNRTDNIVVENNFVPDCTQISWNGLTELNPENLTILSINLRSIQNKFAKVPFSFVAVVET